MSTKNELLCPTNGVQVNETKVRVVAGLVVLTALTYLISGWLVLAVLLAVDFGLRSFNLGTYSPLGLLANRLVRALNLPYKGTDQAPKQFAAGVGLAFSLLITGLHLAHVSTIIPTGVLVGFATLESIAGYCAGCHVYTLYVGLFSKAA